jgi:hypothetical protein
MEGHAPVYVRVNEYEEVLTLIENIKKKVKESHELLGKLNELKAEEDRELLAWHDSLEDISNRLGHLDKSLLGNQ